MSSVPHAKASPRKRPAPPLLIGAAVRLRGRAATGVVIGNSSHHGRVCVRWDDTGVVMHYLMDSLEPVR